MVREYSKSGFSLFWAASLISIFAALLISTSALPQEQEEARIYKFSVVPQQSASKTAMIWKPILRYLHEKTGHKFQLKTAGTIPIFESRLEKEEADFSYMNPYHYATFHEKSGYNAIAKAKDRQIHGIVVVHKDSPIKKLEELSGKILAFPSPAAFAASILPRGYMKKQNIDITPKYVSSHDSVYLNVARGRFVAGGGINRTLNNAAPEIRDNLRILWSSPGYTPHAIAAHSRVDPKVVAAVQEAFVTLIDHPEGAGMLGKMKLKGFVKAKNSEWDDVRSLDLGAF